MIYEGIFGPHEGFQTPQKEPSDFPGPYNYKGKYYCGNLSSHRLVHTIFERGTATCFAYGQTGSGKTHVIVSNEGL